MSKHRRVSVAKHDPASVLSQTLKCVVFLAMHSFPEEDGRSRVFRGK